MRIKTYLSNRANQLRMLVVGVLAICALPFLAAADVGRECVFDPDTGAFVPPNESGACFLPFGFTVRVLDSDFELVQASNGFGDENQWARFNANGEIFYHTSGDKEVFVAYCSPATILAGQCRPGRLEPFLGVGQVMLNTDVAAGGSFSCPLTARIKATGADGYGNVVEIKAALTLVPDPDGGCRATIEKIDATPVVE